MWWLVRIIERPIDTLCVTVNETLKTFVQEVWRLGSQVANGTSVVLLGFLHKPGFVSYLEHRKRIKKIRSIKYPGAKRSTPFVQLCVEDDREKLLDTSSKIEGQSEIHTSIEVAVPSKKSPKDRLKAYNQKNNIVDQYPQNPQLISDLAHYHEHITTGLLEDVLTNSILLIDRCVNKVRIVLRSSLETVALVRMTSVPWMLPLVLSPTRMARRVGRIVQYLKRVRKVPEKLISTQQLDMRSVKEIIDQAGYPYEQYVVTTEDGYRLTLERIPSRNSRHVMYLQHGIFDSSFAWIATGAGSLAFRAHDQGYDVFLGNFRGNGDRGHVDPNISSREYWDFSINEHAFKDIPAFIEHINSIKKQELSANSSNHAHNTSTSTSAPNKETKSSHPHFHLSVVAHSMGAAAVMMYLVEQRRMGRQHHMSQAILLSPAGYHKTAPLVCDILGPVINACLQVMPSCHVFEFPSDSARVLTAKAFHDLMNHSVAIRDLCAYVISRFLLGGDIKDHPVTRVHNLAYNTFTGTAVKIYRHFWQLYQSSKFQAFDYGPERNLEIYGSRTPTDFMEHYGLIDIPVHFCFGLRDNLIEPANVVRHYTTLRASRPDLAFLKASKHGHLEFTLGLDDNLLNYILSALHLDKANPVT